MRRKTLGSSFPFALVLAAVLTGPLAACEPATDRSSSSSQQDLDHLVGTWDMEYEIDGNPSQAVLELRHSEEGLSGTWSVPGYATVDLEMVTTDGKTVSFARTAGPPGQTYEIRYSATVEHDEMKGTMWPPGGENPLAGKKR